MIKRETVKRTRDFLNSVKRGLPLINRGHITISDLTNMHQVSDGRMIAAIDLGYFRPVGYRGKRPIYKSTVNYFTEDMAAAAIRREYNRKEICVATPSPAIPVSKPPSSVRPDIAAMQLLKDTGYSGVVFKGDIAIRF